MSEEKPWWLREMTIESLTQVIAAVQGAHEQDLGLSDCHMNQVKIALKDLLRRMEYDAQQAKKGTVIRLSCLAGFSYVGKNRVWVTMGQEGGEWVDVTVAFCSLFNAFFGGQPGEYEDTNLPYMDRGAMVHQGCESFTLDDLAGCYEDFIKLPIECWDNRERT